MNSPRNFANLLLLIVFGLISFACSSKELSRSTTQSMIEASPTFKEVADIQLVDAFHEHMPLGLDKASPHETPEQARQRVLTQQMVWQPQMAVANKIGLATLIADFVKKKKPLLKFPHNGFLS